MIAIFRLNGEMAFLLSDSALHWPGVNSNNETTEAAAENPEHLCFEGEFVILKTDKKLGTGKDWNRFNI